MTAPQYYQLKQLAKGKVPHSVLRTWDQRPLRGLFLRGLISLTSRLDGEITQEGWIAYQGTLKPKLREHIERPLFGGRSLSFGKRAIWHERGEKLARAR